MKSLYERMHSGDIAVKAAAHDELAKSALQMGMSAQELYAKMEAHVTEKRAVAKAQNGDRRSKVSFGDIFSPVGKAAYSEDEKKDADADDDMEGSETATPRGGRGGADDDSKSAKPRVVAFDKDADADDDDMDGSEKGNRGVARASYETPSGMVDVGEPEPEDPKKPSGGGVAYRKVAGTTAKHRISNRVSFKSVIDGNSREFPIEDQPQARQPRGSDTSADRLNREYGNEVLARISGGFSRIEGGDPDAIPNAGAGETFEGDTRTTPNSGARFTPGSNYIGGQTVDKAPTVDPMLGMSGSYDRKEIGQVGDIVTRLGNGHVLAPKDPGIAPAASAKFPDAATSVSKSRRPKGLWRGVISGPEGGTSSDIGGQSK